MMYLAIIFCSPLYFMVRGKWGGFTLNAIMYGFALLLLITFVGAFLAPLPWILAVGHAMWHYRQEMMERHASLMATKMAAAMRTPPPTP